MIQPDLHMYLVILPMIFLAGVLDSIAGGGGLISLPTYLLAGLPPHYALGTNKFSSAWGTLFATHNYWRNKMIDTRIALTSACGALLGSWLGTRTVLMIKPDFLNYLLVVLIPIIAVITLLNQNIGNVNTSFSVKLSSKYFLGLCAGLVIGFYDGFFGPGTGTFLILIFAVLLKYDFVIANGNTKVVNLSSNIAALLTFLIAGRVYFPIAIPAAIVGIMGNLIGSRFVVLRGNKLIKPIFIIALSLLMGKVIYNIVFPK
ncbi:MAG: TSUP family transporter [Candidatus Cloacimonetes bacterium]|nr:TSUP family transporter [Candidatus Cloacimonadota bacterium]